MQIRRNPTPLLSLPQIALWNLGTGVTLLPKPFGITELRHYLCALGHG